MTLPSESELRGLSREALLALVLQLAAQVQRLEAEVARLKQPPPTSQNSSQPPSRDQKGNTPARKRPRKRGAKPGHAAAHRPLSDHPDKIVEAPLTQCQHCQADLQTVPATRVVRRQVTEIPDLKPVVIETQQQEVVCPHCQTRQRGVLPPGLEAGRHFGPRLEALVTYLQHEQHLGLERLQTCLHDLFGVELSEGGEVAILERAGEAARPAAEAIGEAVRASAVVGSDETSARVNGRNHWHWVFVAGQWEYHVIAPSRGADVVTTFMREAVAEVWLSDCWAPQLRAPAQQHQICLPHQIRALQRVIDKHPRLTWARELQALFRAVIHLKKRRSELTDMGYRRRVTYYEKRLDRLLLRRLTAPEARKLWRRYHTHRASLLVCLYRPDVPADNNACERALRPSVIHRKVLGGFRSTWGPQAYAHLTTVLNTAKRHGENVFHKLVALMGPPVLPYLNAQMA
jgi:transposase